MLAHDVSTMCSHVYCKMPYVGVEGNRECWAESWAGAAGVDDRALLMICTG